MLRGRQLPLRHTDKGVNTLFFTHSLSCKESTELEVGAMALFSKCLQRTGKLSEHRSMVSLKTEITGFVL